VPKLKASEFTFDEDELENAEYSDDEGFVSTYEGEDPPAGIILCGYARKMWLSESSSGADMLVVAFDADENDGDYEEYNGWSTLDYETLQANTKFKWKPFIDALGLTLKDIKNKMYTEDTAEKLGDVVEKIGTWKPGAENDGAWARVLTKREEYPKNSGEFQTKIAKWLPWEDADEAAPEPQPAPAAPARRAAATAKPATAKPAPASRRTAKAAPVEEPDVDEDADTDVDEEVVEETPTPASSRRGRGPSAASTPAAKAPAPATRRRGPGRGASGSTEAPPF
jgi:hypothetical protein